MSALFDWMASNGVGRRFRARINHMGNRLPENDSRPLPAAVARARRSWGRLNGVGSRFWARINHMATRLPENDSRPLPAARFRAWWRLTAWAAVAAGIWMIVLPWVAARPAVQRRLEFHRQQRINPSAMFYTEVDVMDEVLDRMDRLRRQHPERFWPCLTEKKVRRE
jgi:hypothetical protein